MKRKAESWKQYGQAALLQPLLESLPQLVSAAAQPLAKTDKIIVVSSGGSNSEGTGVSKITRDVTNIVAQLPTLIESLTGIDILATLKNLPGVVP